MKTFDDLVFTTHEIYKSGLDRFKGSLQARMDFENGYGVSVLFGKSFYSNGIDTYEVAVLFDGVAVLFDGNVTYNTDITDDVLGYLSKDEVTEVMAKVQNLK